MHINKTLQSSGLWAFLSENKRLGADFIIDHHQKNYIEEIQAHTNGNGVNVIIDTVGGSTLSDSPLILADYGRVVTLMIFPQPPNLIHAWEKMPLIILLLPDKAEVEYIISLN